MFIKKLLTMMLLIVFLFGNLPAQQSAEQQKNAVVFLRQTIKEIPNLKIEENRQFFMIEAARLLWKYDEKEARAMFGQTIQELKQSFAKSSEKYKIAIEKIKKERVNANANYGYYNAANRPFNSYPASNRYYGNVANATANSAVYVEPEINIYETGLSQEFSQIGTLRRNLIESLIDLDVVLAYQVLTETSQMMPTGFRDYSYYSDFLEQDMLIQMLEKNEVEKAVSLGRIILNSNRTESFSPFLTAIYEKDAAKGSKFAEEILQTLKSAPLDSLQLDRLSTFFDDAVSYSKEDVPMLGDKSLRDLAKLLGQSVLLDMEGEYYFYPADYAKKIKDYAPRESLSIFQKAKQKRKPNYPSNSASNYPYANRVANAANAAANAVKAAANKAANYPVNYSANTVANVPKNKNSNSNTNTATMTENPFTLPDDYEIFDSKDLLLRKLISGKFTPEERKEIIAEAKKYAFERNFFSYARSDGFINVVAELARFSIYSADKEISAELMKEAETFVRPETKNMIDYLGKLMLAGGYSRHNSEKSFALMESMTSINDVIESAFKIGVFIDFESNLIINDEINAIPFLADSRMAKDISQMPELRMFMKNLAQADFQRTKGLAEKFNRNEVRMTAKILILDSLLGEESK